MDFEWEEEFGQENEYVWDVGNETPAASTPEDFRGVMAGIMTKAREMYAAPNIWKTVQEGLEVKMRERQMDGHVEEAAPPEPPPMVYPLTASWGDSPERQKRSADIMYKDFARRQRFKNSKKRCEQLERSMLSGASHAGDPAYQTFIKDADGPAERRRHTIGGNLAYDKKLIEFIQEGNLTNVLHDETIDWADHSIKQEPHEWNKEYDASMSLLVEDQYYPGLIDDAVNRKANFNEVAFCITYGEDEPDINPEFVPPSLLEAFDLRVQRETGARKKVFKTSGVEQKDAEMNSFIKFLKGSVNPPTGSVINRDEVKLANAVEIDLAASLRSGPQNALTRAILCLERAEIMNNYDKKLQAAEEAYSKAPAELAERAAIHGEKSFSADVSGKNISLSGKSYRPIEIVSYIGLTEPIVPPVRPFKE